MEDNTLRKDMWDRASKAGLVLGLVSVAYLALNAIMQGGSSKPAMAFLISAASLILWIAKFGGSIWLMKFFMTKFALSHSDVTNQDTFRFGMATALLSALIFSGAYLLYVTVISPEILTLTLDTAMEAYSSMITSEQLSQIEQMKGHMPAISFFSQLIYCFLFGTVVSAIFARNIPPQDPFADFHKTDNQ